MPADRQPPGDPFDLERFVTAQSTSYADALAELKAGRKQSHWMWFIFPQLRGLGRSHFALYYGISGLAEPQFASALECFYGGEPDAKSAELMVPESGFEPPTC